MCLCNNELPIFFASGSLTLLEEGYKSKNQNIKKSKIKKFKNKKKSKNQKIDKSK